MGLLDDLMARSWVDRRQNHNIDALRDELADAAHDRQRSELLRDERGAATTEQLRATVDALAARLEVVTHTLAVALEMLAEAGALDGKVLSYRVEAALEDAAEPAGASPRPATSGPVPIAIPGRGEDVCANCRRVVLVANTVVTPKGTLCDRCAIAAGI